MSIVKSLDELNKERSERAGIGFDFYGTTAPAGSLACDGSEVSKTTCSKLYAAIGNIYATTGGVPAPNVANFRLPPSEIGGLGLYNRGVGATNGAVGTYQDDVLKTHDHLITYYRSNIEGSLSGLYVGDGSGINSTNRTYFTGDATETRPRSLTVLKCIKY